jgi:metacaspase-1
VRHVIATLLLLGMVVAWAEDRALIINMAEYSDPANNLIGIERDIELFSGILEKLDIMGDEIKVLQNEAATKQGIISAVESWLVDGVEASDRVVFYYSGHGYQVRDENGDEDDGCDEAFVPYDLDFLSDDELDGLLSRIPAREVLVVLDSCFSGTATKTANFSGTSQGKLWTKVQTECGEPVNVRSVAPVGDKIQVEDLNLIGLTATAQNEVALGPLREGEGSVFTQALYDVLINQAAPLSFLDVREATAKLIRLRTARVGDSFTSQTPQVFGPSSWLGKDVYAFGSLGTSESVAPDVVSEPTLQDVFDGIVASSHFAVIVKADQRIYALGDPIVFKVYTSKAGYLNLFDLGPDGALTLIFPNDFNSDNRVDVGEIIEVPGPRIGDFSFRAIEPTGESRIIALVTSEPVDFKGLGTGSIAGAFRVFSPDDDAAIASFATRSVGVFNDATPATDETTVSDTDVSDTAPADSDTTASRDDETPPSPTLVSEHGAGDLIIEVQVQ